MFYLLRADGVNDWNNGNGLIPDSLQSIFSYFFQEQHIDELAKNC